MSLSCTWLVDGQRVPFATPGGAERELSAANSYRASYTTLPSSSVCELGETADGGAESTSMLAVVSGTTTSKSGNAIGVDLSTTTGPGQALVTITNEFADSAIGGGGDNTGTGDLSDTGAQVAPMLALGILWLMLGSAAVRLSARRRT